MEQRCFNQHGMGTYTVDILSKIKIKIPDLKNTKRSLLKREEGTYHHNEKLTKEMPGFLSPWKGKGMPLLLIPEYSGINKGQRFPDRSITAHGKPLVKCFLTVKRLFGSSSLCSIRVVSSAYLRLLIFVPAILIPACASSSPAFLLMYSAYKLNKQGDNILP